MVKESKKTGQKTYYHQMMAGVIVHPDVKEVIPLCPEPILKQDGTEKNDCERNAVARWLDKFQEEHHKLPVIITEDGLYARFRWPSDEHRSQSDLDHLEKA